MGGAVSSGKNNDELIDNLKEADYIKTLEVERVFRIVDRAHYYLAECRESAYKDLAWKSDTLHLSAPCIYSEVMEALELGKGMSFLNLGSGTGYLNTMVGFMIGPYGINHGIELHADNVKYAYEKLTNFITESKKFDDLELCEPQFVVGNCLNLAPENRLYDRVYCGAACPPEQKEIIQNMIKLNGIVVIPVGDQLLKIKRISETEFTSESVLPVSFASLVLPAASQGNVDPIVLPEVNPLSLQCICRVVIRNAIRDTFDFHLPAATEAPNVRKTRRQRSPKIFRHEGGRYPLNILPTAQGLMIMGAFDPSEDEDDDDDDDNEDDGEGSEKSDDSAVDLDRQLRHHASEIHKARERTLRTEGQNETEDIDSDLSEEERKDDRDLSNLQSKDLNGNKSSSAIESSDDCDKVELMESDSGAAMEEDDKADKVDKVSGKGGESEKNGNKVRQTRKMTNNNAASRRLHGRGPSDGSYSNPYERIADRILTIMAPRRTSELSNRQKRNSSASSTNEPSTSTEPSTSLPSDDDVLEQDLNSRSQAIEVAAGATSISQPRAIKESYSTSADTSETSGFGSLGDEVPHIGSQHSGMGSLKDDMEMISAEDFLSPPSIPDVDSHGSPWSKSSQGDSILDNDNTGTDSHDSADCGWMEIGDEDEASDEDEEEKVTKKRADKSAVEDTEDDDDTNDSPRGPDFTAFLRTKVETLPIPSTLKSFILHYRKPYQV